MKINLSPVRRDDVLQVVRAGSTLIVNGEVFDFLPLAEGEILPASAIDSNWFEGQVSNVEGVLELTLILPLPANYSPEQAFPIPLIIADDGPVVLPRSCSASGVATSVVEVR